MSISFTDHVWLLVTGQLPGAAQRRVLDATLVAIAEHGLVPSVAASRMTLAAAPEALQGAVAAGILGCGSVILGSADAAARLFAGILARMPRSETPDAAARAVLGETARGAPAGARLRPSAAQAPGSARGAPAGGGHRGGHRRAGTSRSPALVERLVPEIWGKPLAMNVSGAIAAVLLDAGYPLLAVKGVPMLARTASLIAHLTEEQQRPIGFVLADSGASAIDYDGQRPDGFVPGELSGRMACNRYCAA